MQFLNLRFLSRKASAKVNSPGESTTISADVCFIASLTSNVHLEFEPPAHRPHGDYTSVGDLVDDGAYTAGVQL